jgi:hypothetical protein
MRIKKIELWGCLCKDRMMGCFPFLCAGVIDVPTSSSLSSQPDSGSPIIYLSFTSSCYVNSTKGCDLGPSYSLLSLSTPFVLWDASALEGWCGFLVSNGLWPCALSCELMLILKIVGAYPSSSISVVLIGLVYDEGIASTLAIPFVCVNACSTFAVSDPKSDPEA